MKVRDIIKAMELAGWGMEKRTATGHRKFSHSTKPGKVTVSGQLGEDVPTGTLKAIMKQTGVEAMKYAVIFEQGPSSVGVTVPDLPGCFAVAPNLAEARSLIAEAIAFHIESLREDRFPVPEPTSHAEDVNVAA